MNQFVNYQWRNSTKIIRETLRENANLNKEEPGKGLRDFYKKLKQKGNDRRTHKSIGVKRVSE